MKICCLFTLLFTATITLSAQESSDSLSRQKIDYYFQTGWQWSGHSGLDAAVHFIIKDKWLAGIRMLVSDYCTRQYPFLETEGNFNGYPYSHEEFGLQFGRFYSFKNKHWFVTLETGPSYVRYFYPIGIDSLNDGKGKINYSYNKDLKTSMGWTFSGAINWHHKWIAAGVGPQYFANPLHAYGAITVSIFIFLKEDY